MSSQPLIIGIAGGTCSGKSTLVASLSQRLGSDFRVSSVMMDKYWLSPGPTVIAPITRVEYMERNHPDALDQERLFSEFDRCRESGECDILFIEGLFALRLERVRETLDLKVFVDLQSDERLYRRIKRWMSYGEPMDQIVSRYLDTVRFRHDELVEPTRWHADIVINGTLDLHKGADVLEIYIRRAMAGRAESRHD